MRIVCVDFLATRTYKARRNPHSCFAHDLVRKSVPTFRDHAPLPEAPLAGHSQFKNIMHRKGRQDAIKSKVFGKLAREITVSAKMGLPDPDMNPRLRAAILAARAESMPNDNIARAIKKASGN